MFQIQRQGDTIRKLQEAMAQVHVDLDETRKRADDDVSTLSYHIVVDSILVCVTPFVHISALLLLLHEQIIQ